MSFNKVPEPKDGFWAILERLISLAIVVLQTVFGQSTPRLNFPLPPTDADNSESTKSKPFPPTVRQVIINGVRLSDGQVNEIEQKLRVALQNGAYWYDPFGGSWGMQGGPLVGFIQAGLDLGGPLRADASNGNTGVFVNGRQLHFLDVQRLQQLGPVFPGRYWADSQGNFGYEGGPALGNYLVTGASMASTVYSPFGTLTSDGSNFFFQGSGSGTRDDTFYSNW